MRKVGYAWWLQGLPLLDWWYENSKCALDDLGDLDVHTQHVLHKQINDGLLMLLEISLDVVHVFLFLIAISWVLILNLLLQLYKKDKVISISIMLYKKSYLFKFLLIISFNFSSELNKISFSLFLNWLQEIVPIS